MEGLVELHDNIMYYLVVILFAVAWVLLSIVRNYIETKSPISHKYLNHGIISVPAQKCSNHIKYNQFLNSCPFGGSAYAPLVYNYWKVRGYSTSSLKDRDDQFIPYPDPPWKRGDMEGDQAIYEDASSMQKAILKDNAGKSGIYMLNNYISGKSYIDSSINLTSRFYYYLADSGLSLKRISNKSVIARALLTHGFSEFSLHILAAYALVINLKRF